MSAFALEAPLVIHGDALFARNRTLRRQIRRWWVEKPKRWAAWLMLNPSDAGAEKNDPTALRVTHFTRSWGYDGWIGINLYPFISSTPDEMWAWSRWQDNGPDWYARDDMQQNLADIEEAGRRSCLRMVAFGAAPIVRDQNWLMECLERFQQPFANPDSDSAYSEDLWCLGTNKTGQPLHPMARGKWRVPDDRQHMRWSLESGVDGRCA